MIFNDNTFSLSRNVVVRYNFNLSIDSFLDKSFPDKSFPDKSFPDRSL